MKFFNCKTWHPLYKACINIFATQSNPQENKQIKAKPKPTSWQWNIEENAGPRKSRKETAQVDEQINKRVYKQANAALLTKESHARK